LSAKHWGLYDSIFQGEPLILQRPLGCYVMENVLFKVSFPAEFHAQTAVEAALQLHMQVKGHLDRIEKIEIETHESALRIIDKQGPLYNPADRDHCLQYMIAIALIFGNLTAEHYEEDIARDPRIDKLRARMVVRENKKFSQDYLDHEKRAIANALTITFNDGTALPRIVVEYPLGHRSRREEARPLLFKKCYANLSSHFSEEKSRKLVDLFQKQDRFLEMPVKTFMDALQVN
jgi:2-methylcitrate dehydratase